MVQARVVRNTARIVDAGIALAAEGGWSELSLNAVAQRAGLSMRAVQSRAEDREALATLLWTHAADGVLHAILQDAVTAAGLLGAPADAGAFVAALNRAAQADEGLLAATELLMMAQFIPGLGAAVGEGVGAEVAGWCRAGRQADSRTLAARRGFVVLLVLGLLAASRRPGSRDLDLADDLRRQLAALTATAEPQPLPDARPPFRRRVTEFGTGDPIHEALLAATLDQVGARGYEAATTRRIAEQAGVSETTIFLRHANKLSLFTEATSRQLAETYRRNAEWERALEEAYGEGIASAVTMRESMRPDIAAQRAIYLEQVRVSWHDADLLAQEAAIIDGFLEQMRAEHPEWAPAQTAARGHLAYATGLGIPLLPILDPRCWRLPFDVVTVPITASA